MSISITRAQLEQHAALSAMLGVRNVDFAGSRTVLEQLRQLPNAEYRYELKITNDRHEFFEWCSVEIEGVRYSVCCIKDSTPKQFPGDGGGRGERKLRSVP